MSDKPKFELGQAVFVVFEGKIFEAEINSIITEQRIERYKSGCIAQQIDTLYECIGDFIYKGNRGSYYSRRQTFKDDKIFVAKEEAVDYVKKHFSERLRTIGDSVYVTLHELINLRKRDCYSDENYEFVKMARNVCKFIIDFKRKMSKQ